MVIYMFRDLLNYCVTSISVSGSYSLSVQYTSTHNYVYVNFWSGSVYYQICLGSGPRGLLIPKKILRVISSFITLFDSVPSCISLIDCSARLEACLLSSLPGQRLPSALCSFGPTEFERCLSVPTSKILERHDFRTILDFLLMKLRTALDRDWVHSLPVLHKVVLLFSFFLKLYSRPEIHVQFCLECT